MRIYSARWDRLSRRHLSSRPICERHGCGKPAAHVDHIVSVERAPWRQFDSSNLQSLCQACHNRLTAAYDRGTIRGACDEDGMPLDPGHPWAQPTTAAAIAVVNNPPKPPPALAARLKYRATRQL